MFEGLKIVIMSYKNRFGFKQSVAFKHIIRGFEYLDKIRDFQIDGNIVYAKIYGTHPYDVCFAIDFKNRKVMYANCTCPYMNEHKMCKHISALMLYVDLYINGGSVKELCVYHLANVIVAKLKELNEKLPIIKEDVLKKQIVGKNINLLSSDCKYATAYFELLDKVNESTYKEALELLFKKRVVNIDIEKTVWIDKRLSKNYSDLYHDFYAKNSLLKGYGDYIYDPFEGEEYYDEDQEYYYAIEVKEKNKGINLVTHSSIFRKDKYKETIFYDFQTDEIFFGEDIENHISIASFDTFDISNNFIEFFISSEYLPEKRKVLLEDYQNGTFSFENLDNTQKARYRKLENNYFIGKGIEFCLDNHYDFCLRDYNF